MASLCVLTNGGIRSGLSKLQCENIDPKATWYEDEYKFPTEGWGGKLFNFLDIGGDSGARWGNILGYGEGDEQSYDGNLGFLSSGYGMNDPHRIATNTLYDRRANMQNLLGQLDQERADNLFVNPKLNVQPDSYSNYTNQVAGTILGDQAIAAGKANQAANNALLNKKYIRDDSFDYGFKDMDPSGADRPEVAEGIKYFADQRALAQQQAQAEQLRLDEKDTVGLPGGAVYTPSKEYLAKQQSLFDDARTQRAMPTDRQIELASLMNPPDEDSNIGLTGYVPNQGQVSAADQSLFDLAKAQRGIPTGDVVQPTRGDLRLPENDGTIGQELVIAEDLDKAEEKTDKIQVGPRWYESINDPDNPNSIRSQIYNTIIDSGMDKMFDSIDDNSPQWLQDWAAGIKTDIENRDWLKAGAKLWVTKKGSTYALKTLWKLLPFTNGKFLTAGNVIKIGVAAEVYEMSVDSDVPIMTQIQNKIEAIMAGGAAGGPQVVEVDEDGNVVVPPKEDTTTKITPIDAVSKNQGLWAGTTDLSGTPTDATTGILNTGTAQQQGYSGNIGDMFSNLWNPNPETMDYWYKTREGDIPGNNRMREAMARLAYMGLYPEDRGTDPYQALTDDRVSYTNNLLDVASSQATLNATANNRLYNQYKDMVPSQNELAKQLVKQKGWAPWGLSQAELDSQADLMAGNLRRQFLMLASKGIAPNPENLKVYTFLEENGITPTAESINYALENGVLEAMKGAGDDDGGNTQTAVGAVQSMKSMISNAASAFTQ